MSSPTVLLQPTQLEPNLFRIDVLIQHLPEHFVGLGFDLMMDGSDWSFEKYELGEIFHQPENVLVLATQKDQPARLVFGLSLKGDSLDTPPKLFDGTVVSFYLRAPEVNFQLANQVLSVLDQGRKDVAEVTWQAQPLALPEAIAELSVEEAHDEPVEQETQQVVDPLAGNMDSTERSSNSTNLANNHLLQANTFGQDFTLPLLLGILAILVILLVVLKIRRKGLT